LAKKLGEDGEKIVLLRQMKDFTGHAVP